MRSARASQSRPSPTGVELGISSVRSRGVLAAILIALTIAAYLPVLNAGFIWDDESYVTDNEAIRTVAGLQKMWFAPSSLPQYYPLVYTTFWIEYQLWGLAPLGYHVVNLAMHIVCALLLWRLLSRLNVPGAWLAAAIFAVHPVEVESVAWVTERKNVLSLALALGSILCYLRFAPLDEDSAPAQDSRRGRWYVWSLVLFALALFSKTAVVPLPPVLLVLIWWKRGRITWADIRPVLPMFAIAVALGLLTVWVETYHVVARGEEWNQGLPERVLIASRALWFYAAKICWPHPLTLFYERWIIDRGDPVQWIFPIAAIGLIAGLWFARHKIGRGPLAGVLIFTGVMAPALGFFNIYYMRFSFVADHFQYHASVALIALIAAGLAMAVSRLPTSAIVLTQTAAALLLLFLAGMTFAQSRVYKNLETLYLHALQINPDAWIAHTNLGKHYLNDQNKPAAALPYYRRAAELQPKDASLHATVAGILAPLADKGSYTPGELNEAIELLQLATTLAPDDAGYHATLGFALFRAQRAKESVASFARAIELAPNDAYYHYGAGIAESALANADAAERSWRRAVEIDPKYTDAYFSLGLAQLAAGRVDEARLSLEATLRIDPNFAAAYQPLGDILVRQNEPRAAADRYSALVRLAPNDATAHDRLGIALAKLGQAEQAVAQFDRALQLAPDNAVFKTHREQAIKLIAPLK